VPSVQPTSLLSGHDETAWARSGAMERLLLIVEAALRGHLADHAREAEQPDPAV
jgi:hypothetical protein